MSWRALKFYLLHPVIFLRRIGNYIYDLKHPNDPWLSQGAVKFLDENLTKDMKLFEWGSGKSTMWFAERVKHVVSIEYNREWFKIVEKKLKEKNINNVDLRYIALEHPLSEGTPRHYDPTPKYVSVIHEFQKPEFDLIIIDGHYRLTCSDQCLESIKSGGYLLIDNSNRIPKQEWGVPPSWELVHESSNVMTQTSIWRKPL